MQIHQVLLNTVASMRSVAVRHHRQRLRHQPSRQMNHLMVLRCSRLLNHLRHQRRHLHSPLNLHTALLRCQRTIHLTARRQSQQKDQHCQVVLLHCLRTPLRVEFSQMEGGKLAATFKSAAKQTDMEHMVRGSKGSPGS